MFRFLCNFDLYSITVPLISFHFFHPVSFPFKNEASMPKISFVFVFSPSDFFGVLFTLLLLLFIIFLPFLISSYIPSSWNLCLFYILFSSQSVIFLYYSFTSIHHLPSLVFLFFFLFPISFFSPSSSVTPSVRTLFLYILLYSVLPALHSCFCSFISCLYSKL